MSDSIFEDTMADMTFPEVEQAVKNKAAVLLPVGVMEEHGPHLCLGTDTYLIMNTCRKVKRKLAEKKVHSIIAPPFYWGINSVTDGFPGSFTSHKTTMISMMIEIMACLKRWGFESIFPMNMHLDAEQEKTIIDTVKAAFLDYQIHAYYIMTNSSLGHYGLTGDEGYILSMEDIPFNGAPGEFLDIHAGGLETSWMLAYHPNLVRQDILKKLESTRTTISDFQTWKKGGEFTRSVTPQGYCGDPQNIDLKKARELDEIFENEIVKVIYEFLTNGNR